MSSWKKFRIETVSWLLHCYNWNFIIINSQSTMEANLCCYLTLKKKRHTIAVCDHQDCFKVVPWTVKTCIKGQSLLQNNEELRT